MISRAASVCCSDLQYLGGLSSCSIHTDVDILAYCSFSSMKYSVVAATTTAGSESQHCC